MAANDQSKAEVDVQLEAEETDKADQEQELSDFDKGQIVMARRLGESSVNTAGLVGCSQDVVIATYQKWSKEGQSMNQRRNHGLPTLVDACGDRKLAPLVRSNKRPTLAQIAEKLKTGRERKGRAKRSKKLPKRKGQEQEAQKTGRVRSKSVKLEVQGQ